MVQFDQGELLAVIDPLDVVLGDYGLRIGRAKRVTWVWSYDPGREERLDYVVHDTAVFVTDTFETPGRRKLNAQFPAVELLTVPPFDLK